MIAALTERPKPTVIGWHMRTWCRSFLFWFPNTGTRFIAMHELCMVESSLFSNSQDHTFKWCSHSFNETKLEVQPAGYPCNAANLCSLIQVLDIPTYLQSGKRSLFFIFQGDSTSVPKAFLGATKATLQVTCWEQRFVIAACLTRKTSPTSNTSVSN